MAKAHPEHGVSCVLVDEKDRQKLLEDLQKEKSFGVAYVVVDKKTGLEKISPPALLIVTEEDYASDEKFAESIRAKAAYFLNMA